MKISPEVFNNLMLAFAKDVPVDDIPKCFGTVPQGRESAWAKGCMSCPMHENGSCYEASKIRYDMERKNVNYDFKITDVNCDHCDGGGILVTKNSGREFKCPVCDKGKIRTYKFIKSV